MASKLIEEYLDKLYSKLKGKAPGPKVVSILGECGSHLVESSAALGGDEAAETEAIKRFGSAEVIAAAYVQQWRIASRRANWWAFSVVACLPLWPMIGILWTSLQPELQVPLILGSLMVLPTLTALAFTLVCIRARRFLLGYGLAGLISGLFLFSIASSFLYIGSNGFLSGMWIRSGAAAELADMKKQLPRLADMDKLLKTARYAYLNKDPAARKNLLSKKGYFVPNEFKLSLVQGRYQCNLTGVYVASPKLNVNLWNSCAIAFSREREAYDTMKYNAQSLSESMSITPFQQFPRFLISTMPIAGLCAGMLVVLNVMALLFGSLYDRLAAVRARRAVA